MSDKNIRRVVGGLGAFAVAAGFAVVAGAGVASAAPATISWNDGNTKFTRTLSEAAPTEGQTVTVSTKFERSGVVEYIYTVTDAHPACWTVTGAKVDGQTRALAPQGADTARVAGSSIEWPVYPNINPKSRTFEFTYTVGADCARDIALTTGLNYTGSLGAGNYPTKGPSATVGKNVTVTTLGAVSNAQVGQASTLSATVTGGANGDPVDFYDGGTKVGSGNLNNGTATYSWTPTVAGSHSLVAKFAATGKANASESAAQVVTIAQANQNSSISLAAVSGAQVGIASTLTATVAPPAAGGTVVFKDGATTLATVSVADNGKAAYSWTPATAGSHAITATFSGRTGVSGSTTNTTVEVAEAPAGNVDSQTAVTVSANPKVGVAGTLSAKVTPGTAGTVTFKDGDTVVGTATVDGNGDATTAWTPATEGQRVITAEFSGAGNVNASSGSVSVQVAAADTPGTPGGSGSAGSLENIFGS